jgi:hypothetical protein
MAPEAQEAGMFVCTSNPMGDCRMLRTACVRRQEIANTPLARAATSVHPSIRRMWMCKSCAQGKAIRAEVSREKKGRAPRNRPGAGSTRSLNQAGRMA